MTLGAPEFEPRWTNRKALRIGWLAGQGYTSTAIAAELADGTTAGTIRPQFHRAGISLKAPRLVPVGMTVQELRLLNQRAVEVGLAPADWLKRIAVAAARDDLYGAIVDV